MEDDLLAPTRKLINDTMMGIFDVLDTVITDPEIKQQVLDDMQSQLKGSLGDLTND